MGSITRTYFVGNEITKSNNSKQIERVDLIFFRGDSDRIWYELETNTATKTIGNVKKMIPRGPEDPNQIIDALILFYPNLFKSCPSLEKVESLLATKKMISFDVDNSIDSEWNQLRTEALSVIRNSSLVVQEYDIFTKQTKKITF